MRVTILAPGSRGDVQPYIALGQALRALGHQCNVLTTLDHAALVTSHGLDVATIPMNVAAELQRVRTTRAIEGGGLWSSFRELSGIARRSAYALAELALSTCRGSDVIVTGFAAALAADGVAKKLGVPVVQAYNVPITTTGSFPGALCPWLDFGPASRRLGHRLTRAVLWSTARSAATEARAEVLGAPRTSVLPGGHPGLLPGPVLYGFSEAFLPRPNDWPADVRVTGFWFAAEPSGFSPPLELQRFLDAGPPPVCIGFGSMSTERPTELGAMAIEAARTAGVRLVLLSGWAGLGTEMVTSGVMTLGAMAHDWLYPRCSAVVHHGGAGTTAAALRAGIPAVVVPFHGDQPFWARRVHQLGLGPAPIPRRKLTARRLAAAIALARTSAGFQEHAAAMGRRVRSERGAMDAAMAIVEQAGA